jgi:demethylmenaquinone methyltransferase / 2-methoxy-6-polyprenyl-1,4-benzoquinol methylase
MNERGRPAASRSALGLLDDEPSTASAVREMFAAVAPRYDFLNHFLSLGLDLAWRRDAAKALRDVLGKPGSLVADLCCGTGDLTFALARHSAGTVLGADFCHPMLRRARDKARERSRCVFFLEADALALPFPDQSLDVITLAFGFRNLTNYGRGVEEIRRVLKRGGLLAILEFSQVCWPVFGPLFRFYFREILPRLGTWISGVPGAYQYLFKSVSHFYDQESLAASLSEAGFKDVRFKNITGGVAALHLAWKA